MPFYEYECQACGEQLEALQKMNDPALVDCPACDKPALQKKISAAGFRLKGGGWYETDFKGGKKKNLTASDAGGTGAGSSGEAAGGCGAPACSTACAAGGD